MQRHLLVVVFQTRMISNLTDAKVATGKTAVPLSKLVPHVIFRGVPLSVMAINNNWFSVGVPARFVVMDVMSVAKAVIEKKSTLLVLIVGVADEASVPVRFVILLLVNVCAVVVSTVTVVS